MFGRNKDEDSKMKGQSSVAIGSRQEHKNYLESLNSSPEMTQSFETLVSSLHLLSQSRPLRTVLVTSTQPGEGKTIVTVNLALTMVLMGKKVVLLDGDLRMPRLHRIFQLNNTLGLADILSGRLGVQEVIQTVTVTNGNTNNELKLSVIQSGIVASNLFNPKGTLKLKEMIENLKNVYDVTLFDSPPILAVNDGLLMAPLVDGVILVLNTGAVAEQDAKRAKERLTQVGANILGVVMNRFDEELHGPGSHPYSSYYYTKNPRENRTPV